MICSPGIDWGEIGWICGLGVFKRADGRWVTLLALDYSFEEQYQLIKSEQVKNTLYIILAKILCDQWSLIIDSPVYDRIDRII